MKPLRLCFPQARRRRKLLRDSCFHNLNGYGFGNQQTRGRRIGGHLERLTGPSQCLRDIELPEAQVPEGIAGPQPQGERPGPHIGAEHDPPPIDAVDDPAGQWTAEQVGNIGTKAQQRHGRRRLPRRDRLLIGPEEQGEAGDPRAQHGDQLPKPDEEKRTHTARTWCGDHVLPPLILRGIPPCGGCDSL